MKKLLFSVIITLSLLNAQIDWRIRQWVKNYLHSEDSTIDTVYVHYTDSLYLRILISAEYIDGDSINFEELVGNWANIDSINGDTLYIDGGAYIVRLHMGGNIDMNDNDIYEVDSINIDDVVANWAVLDTLECEFLFMDNAGDSVWLYPDKYIMFNDSASQRDSIYWDTDRIIWKHHHIGNDGLGSIPVGMTIKQTNMTTLRDSFNINMVIGRRDSSRSASRYWSPCTMLIWTNVDKTGGIATPLHPGFYRIYTNADESVDYTTAHKGALIIDSPNIADETSDDYGEIILQAKHLTLDAYGWRNAPGDVYGKIYMFIGSGTDTTAYISMGGGTPEIEMETTSDFVTRLITNTSKDTLVWRLGTPGGVSQMIITKDTAGINLDSTMIRGGVLHAKDSIITVQSNATNSTVDSIDAQHGVFDTSLQADSTNTNHLVVNDVALFGETMTYSNSTAGVDTSLYIKHYGSRTGDYGLMIALDTSENTAANVKLIDLSGSNAANKATDHWIYCGAQNYWTGVGGLYSTLHTTTGLYTNVFRPRTIADISFQQTVSYDFLFAWEATDEGDFILRDGNLGVANADFFQIQDSAGNVVAQISNTGDLVLDSVDAQHVVADVHAKIESLDVKKQTVDTLIYATTVDRCLQISVTLPRLGTGSPPATGVEDQFKTLDFDKASDEDVFFQLDIPVDYKSAGAIDVEVCFFVDGTVIGDTFVVWGCEYKSLTHDNAEVFDFDAGTATKLDTVILVSGESAKLYRQSAISLTTSGFVAGDLLLCRIYRDADNAKDDYDGDARVVHFEMIYEADKPGRYN